MVSFEDWKKPCWLANQLLILHFVNEYNLLFCFVLITAASLALPEHFALHLQCGKEHYVFAIFNGFILSTKFNIYEIEPEDAILPPSQKQQGTERKVCPKPPAVTSLSSAFMPRCTCEQLCRHIAFAFHYSHAPNKIKLLLELVRPGNEKCFH